MSAMPAMSNTSAMLRSTAFQGQVGSWSESLVTEKGMLRRLDELNSGKLGAGNEADGTTVII